MPKIGPKYVFLKVSETVRFGRMPPTQDHVCHTDHIYRSEGVKVIKSEQN